MISRRRRRSQAQGINAEETMRLALKYSAMPRGSATAAFPRLHTLTTRSLPSVLLAPEVKGFDENVLTSQAKINTRQLKLSVSLRIAFHAERSILASLCRRSGLLACMLRGNRIAFSDSGY